jgi:hypothetical protein
MVYTEGTGRRIGLRRDATRAPIPAPERHGAAAAVAPTQGPRPRRALAYSKLKMVLTTGSTLGLYFWGSIGETASGKSVSPAWVEQCPFCGEIGFSFKPAEPGDRLLSTHAYCIEECKLAKEYDVMSWFLDCQVHPSVPDRAYRSCHSPMLDLAYQTAKSARLEDPKYSSELRGIAMATRQLKGQRLFCTHDTMVAIRNIARALRSDPNCPRYEDNEPWYVPHLAHLRSGNRGACPCYSCEHDRRRPVSQ